MADGTIRKYLSFGQEASHGSMDANGVPDATAIATWRAIDTDGESVATFGEPVVTDVGHDQDSLGRRPVEPDAIRVGGVRIKKRRGEISFSHYPRGLGSKTVYASWLDHPLGWIFGTAMGVITPPAATDTIAGPDGATSFEPGDLANYALGSLFKLDILPIGVQASQVIAATAGAPDELHHSPAMSRALGLADVARMMQTWYVSDSITPGASLACRIDGENLRQYATGGVLKKLVIEDGPGKRMKITPTLSFDHIYDDHAAAAIPSMPLADGCRVRRVRSQTVTSTDPVGIAGRTNAAFGVGEGSTRVKMKAWKLTIDFTQKPLVDDSDIGVEGYKVDGANVMLEVSTATTADIGFLANDIDLEYDRCWMQTWGPVGDAEGGALYLPAANALDDWSRKQLPPDAVQFVTNRLRAGIPRQLDPTLFPGDTQIARAIAFLGLSL